MQKFLTKFKRLATSNYAMITDRPKFTAK